MPVALIRLISCSVSAFILWKLNRNMASLIENEVYTLLLH